MRWRCGVGHVVAMALACAAAPAWAVEGGLGRPVTGLNVSPSQGIVPPLPGGGWILGTNLIYYSGEIKGGKTLPIAGQASLGIEADLFLAIVQGLYVWDTAPGPWNFASGLGIPYADVKVKATDAFGPLRGSATDTDNGLFDIPLIPLMAGYHFSKTEHVSMGLTVWTPTGKYEPNKLANVGLNNWTFVPSVSYTKIFPESEIELTGNVAVEFYTENPDTDYTNGVLSHVDILGLKRFANGIGVGAVFGWIEQLTDDQGTLADRLGGFKGRSLGIGPILTYDTKINNAPVSANLRWINEFEVENRLEGDAFQFSLTVVF